jgi:hypothetical protein
VHNNLKGHHQLITPCSRAILLPKVGNVFRGFRLMKRDYFFTTFEKNACNQGIAGLDCDCQSSFCISIQIQKQSYFLSRNQKLMVNLAPAIKAKLFLINICLAFNKLVDKNMSLGNSMSKTFMQNTFNVCCLSFFLK